MRRVFADSYYFFALLNRNEHRHLQAREFAATFQGCSATATYAPLTVHACNTVYLCAAPGARYAGGVLSAPSCSVDRIFAGGFQ